MSEDTDSDNELDDDFEEDLEDFEDDDDDILDEDNGSESTEPKKKDNKFSGGLHYFLVCNPQGYLGIVHLYRPRISHMIRNSSQMSTRDILQRKNHRTVLLPSYNRGSEFS